MILPELICYNVWPLFADHILDFSADYYRSQGTSRLHDIDHLFPGDVKSGDVVFVKTDFVVDGSFWSTFEKIKEPFKLVTANSAYQIGAQGSDCWRLILKDDKLLRWFCTNPPDVNDEKIVPLPIGFEEPSRSGGNQLLLLAAKRWNLDWENKLEKILLPYHNFETNVDRAAMCRSVAQHDFVDQVVERQGLVDYLSSLGEYRYVACLHGRGQDLHRLYEALLCGSVPIIQDSSLRRLFEFYGLPVVYVKNWGEFQYPKTYSGSFENVDRWLFSASYNGLIRGE